jgi:hypothetical protein
MCKISPSLVTAVLLPPGSVIRKLKFVGIDHSGKVLGGAPHASDHTISSLDLMTVVVVVQQNTLEPSSRRDAM